MEVMTKKENKFKQFFTGPKAVVFMRFFNKPFILLKIPHLPQKIKNFIIAIVPWLALVGGIISSMAVLLSFVLAVLSLIALDLNLILSMTGSLLLILLNMLFLIKSFKPLRKKDATGWIYLFWANVLGLINSIINIVVGDITGVSSIALTLILTLLGFYLLFEIGSDYTYEGA